MLGRGQGLDQPRNCVLDSPFGGSRQCTSALAQGDHDAAPVLGGALAAHQSFGLQAAQRGGHRARVHVHELGKATGADGGAVCEAAEDEPLLCSDAELPIHAGRQALERVVEAPQLSQELERVTERRLSGIWTLGINHEAP